MQVQVKWRLEGVTDMVLPEVEDDDYMDLNSYIFDTLRDVIDAHTHKVEYTVRDSQTGEYVEFAS